MKSWYESLATISPRSFTEIITPEIAEKLLATSSGNRRMRKKHVTYLVGAIQRGEWRVTNQGIGFDVNGHLRDGHHRLTAVVQSGEPIESLIVLGMPSDAFEVIDIGAKRKTEDLLRVSQLVGQVLRFAAHIAHGQNTPSPDQIKQMLGTNLHKHVELLEQSVGSTLRRTITSNPVRLCAVLCMIENKSTQLVLDQYSALLHKDYDRMSESAKAFERAITTDRGISATESFSELIARSRLVLSLEYASNPRFRVTDNYVASTIQWAKKTILDNLK